MFVATPDISLTPNRITPETRLVLFIGLSLSLHILAIYNLRWHSVEYPAKTGFDPPFEVTLLKRQIHSSLKQTEMPPGIGQKTIKESTPAQKQKRKTLPTDTTKNPILDKPLPGIKETIIDKPEQDNKKNRVADQTPNATILILQGIQFVRGQQQPDEQKKARREFSAPPADPRLVDKTNPTQKEFQSYKNQNGNSVISRKSLFGIDMCLELKEADLNDPVAINMLYFALC